MNLMQLQVLVLNFVKVITASIVKAIMLIIEVLCTIFMVQVTYHPENSHVIPALITRFHQAKIDNKPTVNIWGTGTPKREFLFVDDMARASIHVMNLDKKIYDQQTEPMCSHINVGSGKELTIKKLAETIKDVVKYEGQIDFDRTKPDGNHRKLIDGQHSKSWLAAKLV